jgi:predicted house-cleaning noncanonical NTP pyrophosphatase (MazG superfamily)
LLPDFFTKIGVAFHGYSLKQADFEKALLQKVEEEASGVARARTRKEVIGELADVLDVIDEVRRVKKISAQELRVARQANKKEKGGFAKRFFLVWTEEHGYKTNERRGARHQAG